MSVSAHCAQLWCGALLLKQGCQVRALATPSNTTANFWLLERLSGVFEVNKILLNSRYTALSRRENAVPQI